MVIEARLACVRVVLRGRRAVADPPCPVPPHARGVAVARGTSKGGERKESSVQNTLTWCGMILLLQVFCK